MKEACKYILEFLRSLNNSFKVEYFYSPSQFRNHKFTIEFKGSMLLIEYSFELIDDFDNVLRENRKDDYFYTLDSKLKYDALLSICEKGWETNITYYEEFLNEKRLWSTNINSPLNLEPQFTTLLNAGLKKLLKFLVQILEKIDFEIESIEKDIDIIEKIIQYYKSNSNLNVDNAQVETLSLLKAAAIVELINLETKYSSTNIDRIKTVLNKQIFTIVKNLRYSPFTEIKIPDCAYEYYTNFQNPDTLLLQTEQKEYSKSELDYLLKKLNGNLSNKRKGCWQTFNSDNPDRLSQSANSMVELLDKVISLVCGDSSFDDYLKKKFDDTETVKWADATRKWVGETKSKLHRVKHHINYTDEVIAEKLLISAETIIYILLK